MAWIRVDGIDDASDDLAEAYREVAPKGGPIDNILGIHSLHPRSLTDHSRLYTTIMYGPGPLSRREREVIAVAVSSANRCHY